MSPRTIFVLAVILAYAGVFVIFKRKYLSLFGGIEYLLIGFLLSFAAIDTAPMKPLLYPFLGWIGLLMGLQIKLEYLKGLTSDFYIKILLYVLLSTLGVGSTLYFFDFHRYAPVAGIALVSICYKTSAHFIPAKTATNRFALFFISFLPFISILLLFFFYAVTTPLIHLLLTISAVILFSLVLRMILAIMEDKGSLLLLLIGFILLISETCAVFKLSPIVVNFFVGIYITNFSHKKELIFTTVYKDEKQLYTLFLLLLGMVAGVALETVMLLDILVILLTVSIIKIVAFTVKPMGFSRFNRLLFLAPGGFAIAVMADYWLYADSPGQTVWFSSFLVSIIILQFISIMVGKRKTYRNG